MAKKKWTEKDVAKLQQKPDVKKKTPSKTDLKPISANALTKAAIRYFSAKGFEVWRQNSAAVFDPTKKVFRSNSVKKGVSDIIGFHKLNGQFIAVDIKVGKDKLSPEQSEFLRQVEKAGGVAIVVKSIDDIENFFKTKK
jgi:hypothetical protein